MDRGVFRVAEPRSKDGRYRGQTAKRKLRSLQRAAPECPRQTPPGQTSVHGRTVYFDQRCASSSRPEYRRACQSSVQTETDRKGNASRHLAAAPQAYSSRSPKGEGVDESTREIGSPG